ncbi:MAG TPA: hypothetical protein VFY14_20235, partial [Streptomyces sp.]|nr:hypothetical protein [Streptomyces sp.]
MSESEGRDEIVPEEWPTVYTQVPVWILLSGISGQAYKLYAFLAEHINARTPAKRVAFPKQKNIAKVLRLKNPRQVGKYTDELEALGAVRVEEYRYARGMRRGNRYHVRFNPPAGYQGPTSLSEFYEAAKAAKDAATSAATPGFEGETAGQPRGTENSTSGGTENSTSRGTKNSTAQRDQGERDQLERDDAPSARSAAERRQASTGSRGRATRGRAASGKSRHRLTKAEYDAIKAVRGLLPDDLERALPAKTPTNLRASILAALAVGSPYERTPAQLVEYRLMPRWNGYWAAKFYAGELSRSVVGPVMSMLEHRPECSDISCEDRVNIHTGEPCVLCATRREDRRAAG